MPRPEIPPAVAAVAVGRPIRVVWQNRLGALTFEAGTGPDRQFVKWAPAASGADLRGEAARLRWAAPFTPVPRLIGQGRDESGSWLVTAALPGRDAASARWRARPRVAVQAIGEGLRALHESLPVGSCPFSWSDRWADLAIATWNVTLNYGPGWEGLLLDAYGVAPDAARTTYYRLLGRCY